MKVTLKKAFSLLDGRLSTNIDDVYEMLSYIYGYNVMTHEIPFLIEKLEEINPDWFQKGVFELATIKGKENINSFEMFMYVLDKVEPYRNIEIELGEIELTEEKGEVVRDKITDPVYREILDVETHHTHKVMNTESGVLRWKANHKVRELIEKIGLNDLIILLNELGYDKNSEVYRKLYRDMGYSLSAYWEVFYWDANNVNAANYYPNATEVGNETN